MRIRVLALIVILAVAPAGAADAKRRHHHKRGHHPTRKHVAKPAPTPEPSPQPPKPSKFDGSCDRLVATPLLRLTGKAGGEMDALATPSPSVDPVAAVQDCNGSGLKAFAFDAHFQTTSPISG